MSTFEALSAWILAVSAVAILAGPVIAVLITRWGDDRREVVRRKADVLTALMRTRPMRLSLEHVGALNLIQLEFYEEREILEAYRAYVAQLNKKAPDDSQGLQRWVDEGNDLFVELLHKIGRHLGYGFDKRDLEKLSYGPIGWENDEAAIRMIRRMAMDVMTGRQHLSVIMRPGAAPSPMFPPAPDVPAEPPKLPGKSG